MAATKSSLRVEFYQDSGNDDSITHVFFILNNFQPFVDNVLTRIICWGLCFLHLSKYSIEFNKIFIKSSEAFIA